MKHVRRKPNALIGYGLVNPSWIPEGLDEYHLRYQQNPLSGISFRRLGPEEIEQLTANGNRSSNWQDVLVAEPFLPDCIRGCTFHGLVRIQPMERTCLGVDGLLIEAGLENATLISCDLGSACSVRNVGYLAHTIVGSQCVLSDVDEIYTTPTARFGAGVIRDGQNEDERDWIEPVNESGGRRLLAVPGMTTADAALWTRFRHDADLLDRLRDITQSQVGSMRGRYSQFGNGAVCRSCGSLVDLHLGPAGRIVNTARVENVTLGSSPDEPTDVREATTVAHGVAGPGCQIRNGAIAEHFVLGQHVTLENAARVIHTVVGDNSTIACCEVLHSLIYPAHQQHHNNSFLIAAAVGGQSNIAAGATIGSNHNSRAADGEIHAARGFWPGLCVSLKHNSRFAAYTLIAKGDYPAELDVPLPFSLVSQDPARDRLQLLPAFWWLYNAYALARNSWKFQARDHRAHPVQNIESHCFAPDTVEQILAGMALLERWTASARLVASGQNVDDHDPDRLRQLGRQLLAASADTLDDLTVRAEGVENARRDCIVLKAHAGYQAYRQMALYYAMTNLVEYLRQNPQAGFETLCDELAGPRAQHWTNLGGQIVWNEDLSGLRAAIRSGKLNSWDDIHEACDRLGAKYPEDRAAHAWAVLAELLNVESPDGQDFAEALDQTVEIQRVLADRVAASRAKDFQGHFRRMVFANQEEMTAVLGRCEDDPFLRQIRDQTNSFARTVEQIQSRL